MLQCQTQQPDVVARLYLEPRRELAVNSSTLLGRKLSQRRLPKEIVCQSEGTASMYDDAAVDELRGRLVDSAGIPGQQDGEVLKCQRPAGDGQNREQGGRGRIYTVQTGAHDAA